MANLHDTVLQTSQVTADSLMEKLPVQLTADDVHQNPEFCNLLSALTQHISEDGTSWTVKQSMTQAKEQLNRAKTEWLQYDLLYKELRELLLDHQLLVATETSSNCKQFYKAVQESLTLAELGDYLHAHPDPSNNVTLLGLSHEDINAYNPYKKHLVAIQQKLIPELEARLRGRCENLVNYFDVSADCQLESRDLTFARSSELPSKLSASIDSLAGERKSLSREHAVRQKLTHQYHEALMQLLKLLETLIVKHRMQMQSDSDTVSSEWLAARCDAMRMKLRLLELRLLCDTYHADAVNALTIVRRELDSAVTASERDLTTAERTLATYETVGLGFDDLVQEYTALHQEIDKKKWALREFKFSLDASTSSAL